jgi:hypothetical protein
MRNSASKFTQSEPEVRDIEREWLLVDRLLHAVRIADGMVKPFAEQQIRAGKVTIANNSFLFRGKYEFFRSRVEECYQTAQPVTGEDQVARINRKFRYDREAFFFSSAALDSYFSYLEHLLVLLLPSRILIRPRITLSSSSIRSGQKSSSASSICPRTLRRNGFIIRCFR